MTRELRDLLCDISDKHDLIRAWAVEVGPGGSSLRAQTRRSFGRREDALRAANTLLDAQVSDNSREVRAAVPGTTAHDDNEEWRGTVDVELAPL
jgi:hypothetical protein